MDKRVVFGKNGGRSLRCYVLWAVVSVLGYPGGGSAVADELNLQLPPSSLAQWYKPANKRQVWLHNMFKLRREMQAVEEYMAAGDAPLGRKWAGRLVSHYRKIGQMVPQWRDDLELEWAAKLEGAAARGDFALMGKALRKIRLSCNSCHREYRAVTAMLYRAPDFGQLQVVSGQDGSSRSYPEAMKRLSMLVNRIKIAAEDGRYAAALEALSGLRLRLDELGESCAACHKDAEPRARILEGPTAKGLAQLEQGLKERQGKNIGRALGSVAVTACARCHGVHRLSYDIKEVLAR